MRKMQVNIKAAMETKLVHLWDASIQDAVAIAEVKNEIEDIIYQQGQEVPYNITESEKLEFSSKSKTHSYRVATLEKHHRGNVYALIYGQSCTHILQDEMKQDKNWPTVSVSLQATGVI